MSSYLCLDVAFRNIGFCIFNSKFNYVESGIITCTKTHVKLETFNDIEKISYEIPKCKYKNDQYIEILKIQINFLKTIVSKYSISILICELPHSGGMDYRSTFQMALALSMVSTFSHIFKLKMYSVQPTQSKKFLKTFFNIPKPTKNDSIKFVMEKYPHIKLPKNKDLQHHISDSVLAWEVWKQNI